MGQGEPIRVLLDHKSKWMEAKEIAEILNVSRGGVIRLLSTLYKQKVQFYKLERRANPKFRWGYQWRITD